MFNKKHQMFLIQTDGRVDFIEFNLTYHTSSGFYNNVEAPDLSYTAVVDHLTINLTPLGKLLMPPPMSEKQIVLAEPVSCLFMHGHTLVALTGKTLIITDTLTYDPKHPLITRIDVP